MNIFNKKYSSKKENKIKTSSRFNQNIFVILSSDVKRTAKEKNHLIEYKIDDLISILRISAFPNKETLTVIQNIFQSKQQTVS